jgi:hypothetical protein
LSQKEQLQAEFDKILYNYNIEPKEKNRKLREIEKALVQLLDVRVGQIFYDSWGYDQTQNDFLQIIEVSPTRKTVTCQMIGATRTDTYSVAPNPNYKYGPQFRLHIKYFSHEPRLHGSYPFCSNHDYVSDSPGYKGAWREGSFGPYEGKPVYETPVGMGH